jgi:hypothetical protein
VGKGKDNRNISMGFFKKLIFFAFKIIFLSRRQSTARSGARSGTLTSSFLPYQGPGVLMCVDISAHLL